MSDRIVILGGVAPVEVILPEPRPDPTARQALDSVRAKLRGHSIGPAYATKTFALTAPEVAVLLLGLDHAEERIKVIEILRGEVRR